MKKGSKIALIVLAVLFGLIGLVFIGADVAASYLVNKEVNKTLATIPGCQASCGPIQIRFFSGTAGVKDLRFTYHGAPVHAKDTMGPGIDIWVEDIEIGRIFYGLLLKKQVAIHDIRITRPHTELWLDDEHPETCFPQIQDTALEHANEMLVSAELMKLKIKNAEFKLHSLRTPLDLMVDSLSLTVQDLKYDSTFHYNDSIYAFSLGKAAVVTPDGQMRIETSGIAQEDAGEFKVGKTRIRNTMPRRKLAEIVKEPCTWIDMTVESVQTTAFNPIHKAMNKDFTLNGLKAVVGEMDIFRDERYKPKKPFPMPQEAIMAIPATFKIQQVDAKIKHIAIEFASTDINCGKLDIKNAQAKVNNVTNKRGATWHVKGGCPIEQGMADAEFSLTMNKACDFGLKLHVTDIDINYLNTFIRPLVGITADCHVDTLDANYKGDNVSANGTFRMLYHGLNVQVHGDDNIPYKIVTKNAKAFTSIANSLIPKSNPTSVDIHPRGYKVEWKRNEWQEFPLYLFGPCINGAMKTFLPGLYVHEQTK